VAQCLHEGETQAVLLRKKGPVRCRAVPCRALYPEFLSKGTRLRSVKSGKPLTGERNIREKKYIALMGFAQGTEGKERYRRESVISGESYIRVPLYIPFCSRTLPVPSKLLGPVVFQTI